MGTVGEVAADFAAARLRMVERQLASRDITDERVLAAMARVPRHEFVPDTRRDEAYDDHALPIGHRATISQPYIVALMTQALAPSPTDRALEIGTGSGYGAAVLAELVAHVTTVETVRELAVTARDHLRPYGDRVLVVEADGSEGHEAGAPYDVISVTAAAPRVPRPLLDQLALGGRLIAPVGRGVERLVLIERTPEGDRERSIADVRFVPLTGKHGV